MWHMLEENRKIRQLWPIDQECTMMLFQHFIVSTSEFLAPKVCDACPNVQIGHTIRMRKKRSDISSLSIPELCSCEMNKGYALSFVPGVLQIRAHSWKNCITYMHERKHKIISF